MHLDFLTIETCCGSTHTREVCQTTRTLKETKFLFLLGSSVKAVLYSRTDETEENFRTGREYLEQCEEYVTSINLMSAYNLTLM